MAPRIDPSEILAAHLARIHDIALCCQNLDDLAIEGAVRNLTSGVPAYWTAAPAPFAFGASHTLVEEANRAASLISALAAREQFYRVRRIEICDLLDTLIPLNVAAMDELGLLYRLQSTFRNDLGQREERAIMEPWQPSALTPISAKFQTALAQDYAAAQLRFRERRRDAYWHTPVNLALEVA